MADHRMIFSAPMIRALLAGRKTRRKIYVKKGEDPNSPGHLARRLANGLDTAESGKCWEWQRTRNQYGYGTLTINGQTAFAHRLAFELAGNVIPDGMHVLHKCDNPRCINPEHLEIGTRSKNMADCHARGRSRIPSPRMKGESNGSAKLTREMVNTIRDGLSAGVTQQRLADSFDVSQTLISRIKRGEIWND
tara:strand:+ start:106 stop:681 length:576 start_codon:yes stop_codon:yes gene_type:complete